MTAPLGDLRVVDFSFLADSGAAASLGIAGAYATKLLADAGAEVIKVEPPGGDPMRTWSVGCADLGGDDGALFRFLHTSKRSVIGEPGTPEVDQLVADADLVVESFEPERIDAKDLCERGLVVLSITPFGRGGPYAGRPCSEFTIQAESGSIATRGLRTQPPIQAGGRTTEWVGGTFAAAAALAAVRYARRTGHGEHVDFSLLEVVSLSATLFADLHHSLSGRPESERPARSVEVPSVEPTSDGWVGFNTNTRQQFDDFLAMIERRDLLGDEDLARVTGRSARIDEWNEIVRSWTRGHTTAEIVERASALRIPVAPVNNGRTVLEHEQFVERGVWKSNPSGGFTQPRPPYLVNGEVPPAPGPAPTAGEHNGRIEDRPAARKAPSGPRTLPLDGLRVLDLTAWWAGPSATGVLAALGADVIHVESTGHPDGMRMAGGQFLDKDQWWERSAIFLAANTNKRGVTIDLATPKGRELAERLIASCDVLVENFSPRVVESFGLDWATVHAVNPRVVMVRMPAFGLSGPWRDHVGFAQTMEQMTGLAWLTGHVDDQPRIQRGPCDPLAGMHAAFAMLVGLERREETGLGCLVEATMVEAALNAAAEQIVEYTAYGNLLEREGNRSPTAAPQGLYACRGVERWLALSVVTDEQWLALADVLAWPDWTKDAQLVSHAGRRRCHDQIDEQLAMWASGQDLDDAVEALVTARVPAAPVVDPRTTSGHPQLVARGYYEEIDHPVAGTHPIPTVPFRFASRDATGARWLRAPAPTIGQHNHEVLGGLCGLDAGDLAALEDEGVCGTRPTGW